MKLYVPTMDAVLVEFSQDGRVRLDNEDWTVPTVQERRAIIHAAEDEIDNLKDLLELMGSDPIADSATGSDPSRGRK